MTTGSLLNGDTLLSANESGTVVQWFDYAPYGSVIATGQTVAGRQYVNRFSDQSNLDYLNARYYDPARGQFISQDPVFWSKQNIANPQSLNSYSYANDNPINKSDPDGLAAATLQGILQQLINILQAYISILTGGGGGSASGGTSVGGLPSPVMVPKVVVPTRTTTWDPVTNQRISGLDPRVVAIRRGRSYRRTDGQRDSGVCQPVSWRSGYSGNHPRSRRASQQLDNQIERD